MLIEHKIKDLDFIFCGMGIKDRTLKISLKDLQTLCNGRYVDIAKEVDIEEFER